MLSLVATSEALELLTDTATHSTAMFQENYIAIKETQQKMDLKVATEYGGQDRGFGQVGQRSDCDVGAKPEDFQRHDVRGKSVREMHFFCFL